MSDVSAEPRPPEDYRERPDGMADWARDFVGYDLTPEQREIVEAVSENRYVLVMGANGFGKTFCLVLLATAFFYTRHPSSVMVTSGTYPKLKRTFCDDMDHVLSRVSERGGLPGEWKWSPTPHVDVPGEPRWQLEVASPDDPKELEGVHNKYTLGVIEEADKDDVTESTVDSMESLVSDERDRMVVVANPPEDEGDVVTDLVEGDKYEVLRFSSFDSHNVRVELGERDGERKPGLAGLRKIKDDWEDYNDEPWPGIDEARRVSDPEHPDFRDDLSSRWYRRRAGIIPPAGSGVRRPFHRPDATGAVDLELVPDGEPLAAGLDVARQGGDWCVLTLLFGSGYDLTAWRDEDHNENERRASSILDANGDPVVAVDAVGEGSALADSLGRAHDVIRFKAGTRPHGAREEDHYDQWTSGVVALGKMLQSGAAVSPPAGDRLTAKELRAAARVIELEDRERRSGDVVRATPKGEVKDSLGDSPDRLDSMAMASYAAEADAAGWSTSEHGLGEVF